MKAGKGDSYNLNNVHKKLHWEGHLNKGLEEDIWATFTDIRDRSTQTNRTASQNSGGWDMRVILEITKIALMSFQMPLKYNK